MRHEAVAYQVLCLRGCTSMFIVSFSASGFDVTLTGKPNFDVISRLSFLTLATVLFIVIPINITAGGPLPHPVKT